jgi:hypothetical protein
MVLWCYRIANLYGLQKETLQRRRMGISWRRMPFASDN